MATVLIALLAGILTIAAPCTLPILPILLGASVGHTGFRPVFVALGFVISFSGVAIVFSTITHVLGLDQDTLRSIAVVFLVVFGLSMLWPQSFEWLSARVGGWVYGNHTPVRFRSGNVGGFALGATLGLVWTPCAGPVLASILTVIATSAHIETAALLLIVYAIGAALPMIAIAYGGQVVTTELRKVARIAPRLQQAFGVLIIVFAIATYFQYDTLITVLLSDFYPNGQLGL